MSDNIKAIIVGRIEAIAAAEAVTKVQLGSISRELLMYVPNTGDIGMVNRLMGVLTRNNFKVAGLYFAAFLPWKRDEDTGLFTTKIKNRRIEDNKLANASAFLKDEDNNIWVWADKNIAIEDRAKNFKAQIASLVKRALDDNKYGISASDVIASVLSGGVETADLIRAAAPFLKEVMGDDVGNDNDDNEEAEAVNG